MNFEITCMRKSYGKKTPLTGVSFDVQSGRCVAILGKNGSGKSTLLSILAGVQRCDSGEFTLDGKSLLRDKKLHSDSVGYVPQGTPLLDELSARDNLLLWYDKKTLNRELEGGVLKMLGIDEFIGVPVYKMSGGMKKRVAITRALAFDGDLLILDEAFGGLDEETAFRFIDTIKDMRGDRPTLLITHNKTEAERFGPIFSL